MDVALMGAVPVNPALIAGGGIEASWWNQNTTGVFRCACDSKGSYRYTPLYLLKDIRKKGFLRRDSPVPEPEGDDV
jgi:hypothetical protein